MSPQPKRTPHCHVVAKAYRGEAKAPRAALPAEWKVPRRLSALSRAVIECSACVLKDSGVDTDKLPVVFASRFAELYRTLGLLHEWRDYGDFSPAGFALSVHNAPASTLSQVMGGHGSFTTVAAGRQTLKTGMIDAGLMAERHGVCLFLYADAVEALEEPCRACALLLRAGDTGLETADTLEELMQLPPCPTCLP